MTRRSDWRTGWASRRRGALAVPYCVAKGVHFAPRARIACLAADAPHPEMHAWTVVRRHPTAAASLEVWPRTRRVTHRDNPPRGSEEGPHGGIEEGLGRTVPAAFPPARPSCQGGPCSHRTEGT